MTISALPTPPLRSDPANFAARADAFLAALPQFAAEANATAAAMNLNATSDTSASSVAIGLGAKSFQVSAGKSFQGGMYLVIADAAAPSVNSMVCQVTSYSGTTLAVTVLYVRGSGTKAAWVMGLSAPYDRDVGFQDGTQAAPGIAFELDKDTGIRRTGPDAMALVTGGVDAVSVDNEGNLSARGNLRINNQKYLSSGSFGRFWGNASLAVGQAQFAGLYGPTITYNARIVGGAWQSIGGGTATAMTMDEGIFSISQSQAVGADSVPLTWTTSMQVTPAKAEFKGFIHADGGGVAWAPGGYPGAVLGRVGNDAYLTTHYDLSSLTLGSGVGQKNGITIYGHTYPGGGLIRFGVSGVNQLQIQDYQVRAFTRLVLSGPVGNQYNQGAIEVNGGGNNSVKPTIGFHQPSNYAGTLRMDSGEVFGFYQQDAISLADVSVRNLRTTANLLVGVVGSTAKAHIDSSTYGAGLTVGSIANTASEVNIGVGYVSPGRPFVGTNAGSNPLEFGTRAPTPILFLTNSVERMRLADTGELLLGRTSAVTSNAGYVNICADGGSRFGLVVANKSAANTSFAVFVNNSDVAIGSITQSGSAVAYNTTSDHRLKNNVRDSDARRFMQIRFRDYERLDGRHECGLIAHELQEIYPDLVSGEKDAVEMREVELEPAVPAVTERRLVSPAVEAAETVEAAEAVEASPAHYETVEVPELVVIDGVETTLIRRKLVEVKPAVQARAAVEAVEAVEAKEAVYETIVITPEKPAVTELREFPIYQQVNYIGLIGRMGTRLQLVIRQTDAQQELIEQQKVLIGTLTARLDALTERLEVLESAA
ncbi:Intramolecular chaperone auto-processing domain containing protein [Comamonadaceae bacterium]